MATDDYSSEEPVMLLIDGREEPAVGLQAAAKDLGITYQGLMKFLKKHPEIKRYQRGIGKERYLLVRDVNNLKTGRPVAD